MAKYCGMLGILSQVETAPSVWEPRVIEKMVYGDIVRDNQNNINKNNQVNDSIKINNQISIIGDPSIYTDLSSLIYVTYAGAKWKITTIEVKPPRLLLSMGEVYNG